MEVSFIFFYLVIELGYFQIADRYNIIDKPNARSSHSVIVIRGGGIIFPIAFLVPFFFETFTGWSFILFGLLAISVISFLDDARNLNNKVRLAVHSMSVVLLLWQVGYNSNILSGLLLFIVITGIINAYNFMDGINGITALYSFITVGTLFWLNQSIVNIVPAIFFTSLLASLVIFSFFNIRQKAKCFAGDVGSISMAFIICFLLTTLSVKTGSFIWILFLGIYGIDTVFTIVCRLIRKEPIFKAHRSHFYQFLVNELGINYLIVALVYVFVQLLLNCAVIWAYKANIPFVALSSLFVFLIIYVIFRLRFEGRYRLFTAY